MLYKQGPPAVTHYLLYSRSEDRIDLSGNVTPGEDTLKNDHSPQDPDEKLTTDFDQCESLEITASRNSATFIDTFIMWR